MSSKSTIEPEHFSSMIKITNKDWKEIMEEYKDNEKHGYGITINKYKGKLEQKYIGEFKRGYMHGKGKLIDYFQKWTKQGRFVKGSFKK
jgi:hypothetical protein